MRTLLNKDSTVEDSANALKLCSIIMAIMSIVQLLMWAVKRHAELEDSTGKLSLIIPLITLLLAAICCAAYLTRRIEVVIVGFIVNSVLLGAHCYNLYLSIENHEAGLTIVVDICALIVRVVFSLVLFKFMYVLRVARHDKPVAVYHHPAAQPSSSLYQV